MVDTAARPDTASAPTPAARPAISHVNHPRASGPRVDTASLGRQLLGTWADLRLEARARAARPDLQRIEGQSMAEHRERVLGQLKILVDEGAVQRAFPVALGGKDDHGGNIASFEELVVADPSLQIKSGVQWGLFGAAVLHLGTEKHHEQFLPSIMTLETPGAFAMTETGHGSDVAAIGTTATYDPATDEFVIDTPFRGAWKDYLGNAALHGKDATVFAQLITKGVNHGVHCFYVPLRDEHGDFLPGVGGEDDGLKGGLNGIDNGRLHFSGVRIPRDNLLNRYGDVDANGDYTSPIASPGRRFFTMLGTLVQGRVSLDGASTMASAMALAIAVTYGNQRRQFNAASETDEEVLLDYGRHQRRLIPRIATTYAQIFAHDEFLVKFDGVFSGKTDTEADREHLETIAAALKPLSTWFALDTLQEAREALGGSGFLAENRLVGLRQDLDVYVTFEGDNNVLLQLVGKRLLTDYAKRFKSEGPAKIIAGQIGSNLVNGSGLKRLGQNAADLGSSTRAASSFDAAAIRSLLADRVDTMVEGIAGRLNKVRRESKAVQSAEFSRNQNELIAAGRAYAELLQFDAFTRGLANVTDAGTKQIVGRLHRLFGLGLIESHLAWYAVNGRLSTRRGRAVTAEVDRLIAGLRPHAQDLVDAFGYGPEHLRAANASGNEAARQDEARAYYAALRSSGDAPLDEKVLVKQRKAAERAAAKAAGK
ncbi:acyl-CoA dehydrogenase [Agromyces seonyuensis]|uniref:acyl-CoA oxidase n=1 Tax=Agromyces seonyuensis TaxID=2662446 RepID=A0A6I4NTZ9_9MICO|nr:acyl-CoA dehydrogenase [Agromyces seonyuensis]MWB97858.1 acyl-CoA dehydrogenase [Agromyces seonyuensis]